MDSQFGVQSFRAAALASGRNAILVLQNHRQEIGSRSGPFARWRGHVGLVENHRVTGRFLLALSTEYGVELAREVATARGLTGRLGRCKPLTARVVVETVRAAQDLKAATGQGNVLMAQWVRRIEPEGPSMESLRSEINRAVAKQLPDNPSVVSRVNFDQVAAAVERAIVAAGQAGTHKVGLEEARAIRTRVVEREVFGVCADYYTAKARALEAFDVRKQGSVAFQALADGFAGLDPPLAYDSASLTSDAAEELYRRLSGAIASGRLPAGSLDDSEALRAIAQEEASCFFAEREAARCAVRGLGYVPRESKAALLDHVWRDNIPAALVQAARETSFLVDDELDRLAGALSAEELESVVENLRVDLPTSWRHTDFETRIVDEDQAYRWVWRFALASRSEEKARALLRQMAPSDSPLRRIAEAASWYAGEFTENAQHIRAVRRGSDSRSVKPSARDLTKTLHWLWVTLHEKTGQQLNGGQEPGSDRFPNDQTIASLRNLGIPFPAPNRLGEVNPLVPISKPALRGMGEALHHHVKRNKELHTSGLTSNCVKFLRSNEAVAHDRFRARFFLNGRELPSEARKVGLALRNFCTDGNGYLNKDMLANVSRVFDHATLDCVYAGLDAERPDLAIFDGYPEGVYEGHAYSLWKDGDGEVRLRVGEMITPLFLHPANPGTEQSEVPEPTGNAQHPARVTLNGRKSNFSTRVLVTFDPASYEPEIGQCEIAYGLIPGDPEFPYWIRPFDTQSTAASSEERADYESSGSNDHIQQTAAWTETPV